MKSREAKLSELSGAYSAGKRRLEMASIVMFVLMVAVLVRQIFPHVDKSNAWYLAGLALVSVVCADFISGVVHWAADTWGTVQWPVVGPTLIRSFREHHLDKAAITRHDFIEINGDNCLVALPLLGAALFISPLTLLGLMIKSFILFLCVVSSTTSQIHKWAHLPVAEVPRFARALQRMGLVLSPERHEAHHTTPFDGGYCITTGWCNPVLDGIRFFRISERVVATGTGLVPRQDDKRYWQEQ